MAESTTPITSATRDVDATSAGQPAFAGHSGEHESIGQYAERLSTRFGLIVGIAVGLIIAIANINRNPVPMLGDMRAFGTLALISMVPATLISAGYAFVLGVRAWNERVPPSRERQWAIPVIPVGLAYAVLIAFVGALTLQLIEFAFRDLTLAMLQGVVLAAAVSGALTVWVTKQAIQLTVAKMLELTFIVIAIGVYLTAATIDDPLWWQVSFSYLGTMKSSANTIFNVTLAFTGLLVLVWLPLFMSDLRILVQHELSSERSVQLIRIALVVLGVGVALVGIFKSGYTPFSSLVHNWAAYSLAAVFALLMFGARWLVPGLPREFFTLSWILMSLLLATLLLAAIGYFNTVGLEMICFALGLMWLSSFVSSVSALAAEVEPEAFPT